MRSGLRFSLKSGEYYPLTISPLNPRKCWEPEFQYALRDIAGDTYPQADYVLEGVDAHVRYSKLNSLGIDILKGSKPYDQRRPSKSEVARVQEQIERIHARTLCNLYVARVVIANHDGTADIKLVLADKCLHEFGCGLAHLII